MYTCGISRCVSDDEAKNDQRLIEGSNAEESAIRVKNKNAGESLGHLHFYGSFCFLFAFLVCEVPAVSHCPHLLLLLLLLLPIITIIKLAHEWWGSLYGENRDLQRD